MEQFRQYVWEHLAAGKMPDIKDCADNLAISQARAKKLLAQTTKTWRAIHTPTKPQIARAIKLWGTVVGEVK